MSFLVSLLPAGLPRAREAGLQASHAVLHRSPSSELVAATVFLLGTLPDMGPEATLEIFFRLHPKLPGPVELGLGELALAGSFSEANHG